jgi:hypothetical protein
MACSLFFPSPKQFTIVIHLMSLDEEGIIFIQGGDEFDWEDARKPATTSRQLNPKSAKAAASCCLK